MAVRKGFISFLSSMNFMNSYQKVRPIYYLYACQQEIWFYFYFFEISCILVNDHLQMPTRMYWFVSISSDLQLLCVIHFLLLSNSRWCIKSTETFILFAFLITIEPTQNRKGPNVWMKVDKNKIDIARFVSVNLAKCTNNFSRK